MSLAGNNIQKVTGHCRPLLAGTIFPEFSAFTPKHILPNYGFGYRWEFKSQYPSLPYRVIITGGQFRTAESIFITKKGGAGLYWGRGYDNGANSDNESDYKRFQAQVKVDFMFRMAKNFYIGTHLHKEKHLREEESYQQNRYDTSLPPPARAQTWYHWSSEDHLSH